MSELFGEKALNLDLNLRNFGLMDNAWEILVQSPKNIQTQIEAYCHGVNHFVETTFALPLEFWLLREKFDPWLPIHSVGIAKLMMFTTSFGWQSEFIYDYLKTRFNESLIPDMIIPDLRNLMYPGFKAHIAHDSDLKKVGLFEANQTCEGCESG